MTKYKCDECNNGSCYDAADHSSSECSNCNGTGKVSYDSKEVERKKYLEEIVRLSKKINS